MSEESEKESQKTKTTFKSTKPINLKALETEAPAAAQAPSIMSAPREKRFPILPVLIVSLVISVALNIVALVAVIFNNQTIGVLNKQIDEYKNDILDLKNQINALDK
ncbi:hypothetical protein IKF63_00095 [Candidatus Saccharibacteria bacterium]|nr:hypothetical protein [Candidatus Saccharibacteria bacterium]